MENIALLNEEQIKQIFDRFAYFVNRYVYGEELEGSLDYLSSEEIIDEKGKVKEEILNRFLDFQTEAYKDNEDNVNIKNSINFLKEIEFFNKNGEDKMPFYETSYCNENGFETSVSSEVAYLTEKLEFFIYSKEKDESYKILLTSVYNYIEEKTFSIDTNEIVKIEKDNSITQKIDDKFQQTLNNTDNTVKEQIKI